MRWASLGVLAAAGVLLALFWGDVPDRWITHWSLRGPDGWATKTALSAGAPLLIGAISWVLIETLAFSQRRAAGAGSWPTEMVAVQVAALRAIGLGVALLLGGLALALPFLRPRSFLPVIVAAFAEVGIVIVVTIVWATRRTRRLREAGVTLPDGYQGVFYDNPHDPRLLVPKASGLGSTLNFAHRLAWPVMVAILCGPVVVVALYGILAR